MKKSILMNNSNASKSRMVTSATKTSLIELNVARKGLSRNAAMSGAKTVTTTTVTAQRSQSRIYKS